MRSNWRALGALVASCLVQAALVQPTLAQTVTKSSGPWFFGGGVGLGFGDVTYVELSPLVGYQVNERVSVGGSLTYRYRDDERFSPSISTSDYGSSLFARYAVAGPFFIQAEYEYLNYEIVRLDNSSERRDANSVFAGGGISKPVSPNVSLFATALYNLTYSSYDDPAPYDSPWVIRLGVSAGF